MSGGSKIAAAGSAQVGMAWRHPHALSLILDELSRSAPDLARGWFSRLVQAKFEGGVLGVLAANPAQVEYLRRECGSHFVAAAQAVTGRLVSIEFEVAPDTTPAKRIPAFTKSGFTLAKFVVGPGNRFAHASMVAAIEEPGAVYNPLFIHGPKGTGKSHLVEGAAATLRESLGGAVFHFTADSWTAELVKQFEDDTWDEFRRRVRSAGALILDDVQLLGDRPRSLDELFHTINVLLDDQRRIILAADRPPTALTGFPERLIGRFSAGLVAGIDPPDTETRAAILRAKARSLAIEIPNDVIRFLTIDPNRPLHNLLALLTRLDSMSRMEAMPISMEMAKRVIEER